MFKSLFRRREAEPECKPTHPSWFNPEALNNTFHELQSAVRETSTLANNISSQLENRLHLTQQQLSTVLGVVTEGIIITDDQNIIREWNAGAEIIFGFTVAEALGQHINIVVDDSSNDLITRKFDKHNLLVDSNINQIKMLQCRTKTGKEILVEMSINSFPDPSGSDKPGTIAIIRDITEEHKERTAHEYQRKLMLTVINSISDVVMVKDPDGKWILANRAAFELYNFVSEKDYTGKTNMEIAEDFPHFNDSLTECECTDQEAWRLRRTTRTEEVVTDKNGQRQYFDVLKTPIYSSAKDREMLVVVARNVTSLREKREHILAAHKALNAASDIIAICDAAGKITFANKMFMIKYRFADIRDVLGHKMSLVRSPHTPSATYKDIWDTILSGKTWDGVLINRDSTGRDITVETTIVPIIDEHLTPTYFICIQKCIDC